MKRTEQITEQFINAFETAYTSFELQEFQTGFASTFAKRWVEEGEQKLKPIDDIAKDIAAVEDQLSPEDAAAWETEVEIIKNILRILEESVPKVANVERYTYQRAGREKIEKLKAGEEKLRCVAAMEYEAALVDRLYGGKTDDEIAKMNNVIDSVIECKVETLVDLQYITVDEGELEDAVHEEELEGVDIEAMAEIADRMIHNEVSISYDTSGVLSELSEYAQK